MRGTERKNGEKKGNYERDIIVKKKRRDIYKEGRQEEYEWKARK